MNRRSLIIKAGSLLALGGAGAVGWRAATGSMEAYARYSASLRRELPSDPALRDLIGYATLAPNAHNTQPWRFAIGGNAIGILPDHARATPVVDPDDHHLFVSLGCAIETLRVAAEATGRPGEIEVEENGVARYAFTQGAPRADPLFGAIPKRQSTRAEFDGRAVAPADLDALARMAAVSGVELILITERPRVGQIRDLIVAGNEVQMADPAFLAELKQWLRFNPKQAMERGDGLFSAASGNPVLPRALGGAAFDFFFKPASENQKCARQIDSAAGLVIFIGDQADRAHWVAVGRACQRFALAAASLGLRTSFLNQPVEVASLRPQLASLVGASGKRPDLVMRFGYGPELPFAPRRPIDSVLT
ncbi:Acg family FMN-binding oxidoreductase [Bosea thiooxidans]